MRKLIELPAKKRSKAVNLRTEDFQRLCLNAPVFKQLELTVHDRQHFVSLFKLPDVPKELKAELIVVELEMRTSIINFKNHIKINRKDMNSDEDILYVNVCEAVSEEFRKEKRIY